jgi:hypothetical protein
MVAGFVFIKCELGKVESVANKIVEIDGVSRLLDFRQLRPVSEGVSRSLRGLPHGGPALDPSYPRYSGNLNADDL